MISERSVLTMGGLVFVFKTIFSWVNGIKMALEKILEIFHNVSVKITMTMKKTVPDVILRKGMKKTNLCFHVIKFFFSATVQEFDSMQCFLETGEESVWRHALSFLLLLCM